MVEKGIETVLNEIVRRTNETFRRLRDLEERDALIENRIDTLENTVLRIEEDQKNIKEALTAKIDEIEKNIIKIDNELLRINKNLEKAAKKTELKDKIITQWSKDDLFKLAGFLRKKTKPMIIAANKIDVPGAKDNYERLKKEFANEIIVACSSESELALKEAAKHEMIRYIPGDNKFEMLDKAKLNDKQKKGLEFIKTNVLERFKTTGVQDVLNKAVFELLNYIAVYPVANNKLTDKDGNVLPDCFLVPKKTNALEFAYKVHTDIGDNFVKAINLKTKQPVAKDAPLSNNDVIEIMTSK